MTPIRPSLNGPHFGAKVKLESATIPQITQELELLAEKTPISKYVVENHMKKEKNPKLPDLTFYALDGKIGAVTGLDADEMFKKGLYKVPVKGAAIGGKIAGLYVTRSFRNFDDPRVSEEKKQAMREFIG